VALWRWISVINSPAVADAFCTATIRRTRVERASRPIWTKTATSWSGIGVVVERVASAYSVGMTLLERITVEPNKCGGRPCIRGMRIRVTDILGMLAEGVPHEEILRDFPYLEPDDIKAALAYAARQSDHAVLHPA
jgi:uncharacterized protein (DUF433 family)